MVPRQRLKRCPILLIGAGGLGAPLAMQLAVMGAGELTIADGDRVELSNLHRQLIHIEAACGQPKVDSAQKTLQQLCPDLMVKRVPNKLTGEALDQQIHQAQLVIDGSDRFETRYAVNDACLKAGKPLISGAVTAFSGQIATFFHGLRDDRPCYRCLYPTKPAPGERPSCASQGVLGSVSAMVAMLMAAEVSRLMTLGFDQAAEIGTRLTLVDPIFTTTHAIQVAHSPRCPTCTTDIESPTMPA